MDFMNLFKRKDRGTWYARIERCKKFPNGKKVALKTKDKEEAEIIFREMKILWLENRLAELDGSPRISLKDFIKEYTEHPVRKYLAADTLRMDRLALKSLGDVIGQSAAVKTINEQKINQFIEACSARKLSKNTINSYLRHIRAALNKARKWGYIEKTPEIVSIKVKKTLPVTLSSKEIKKILEYSKKENREMWRIITFAIWTGCRRQEILNLKWQDIDENSCKVTGKGGKERMIYLLPDALKALGKKRDIGSVFKRIHKDTVSHQFKAMADACNIKAHFHNLRHTAATHMLKNNIPLKIIKEILGHVDIRTTEIYTQVFNDVIAREMKKLKY
ncbi:MAG: tyrosine-type recombinase/integrase [Thermodesulfobacteriota bacterium]|nr:tyrosine-type recombinase/integrase [Thermodesulfobacteriota bacterium]